MKKILATTLFASALLFGAGCADAPPPSNTPSNATLDVSRTECRDIEAARQRVREAYQQAVSDAGKMYADARQEFSDDLNQCLRGIWQGGPCDKEWQGTQQAYEKVWGNVSNEEAYQNWKKAKQAGDECIKNYDQKQKEWTDKNLAKEKICQEEFQAKVAAAQEAHQNTITAAKAKRDADLATLDALEKACQQKTTTGSQTGGTTGVVGNNTPPPSKKNPQPPKYPPPPATVPASACQPGIPGSQATTRPGKATDFGPKDIAVNIIVQVAEDVTGTPFPTGAIDNQIFAGIVCAKIRTRIAEMTIEESDAQLSSDRPNEIRLRKKIAQYSSALHVWCAIAEGRPALADVKKNVSQIQQMDSGACKTDADCGTPLCCSANSIAASHCSAEGLCVNQVETCPGREVCMGPDASKPLYDHCGPAHEGNWTYGASKPGNWPFPQPGIPRAP
jgi:hypothetical protein